MKKSHLGYFVIVSGLVLLITSCMPGGGEYGTKHLAGFFTGVWHGWIAPVSIIIGFFDANVRVYEINNTGWWYDFGFYIAIISGFGGISLFRKNKKD